MGKKGKGNQRKDREPKPGENRPDNLRRPAGQRPQELSLFSPELAPLRAPVVDLLVKASKLTCSFALGRNLEEIAQESHGEKPERLALWAEVQEARRAVQDAGITPNMHAVRLPLDTEVTQKNFVWKVLETFGNDKKALVEFVGGQLLARIPENLEDLPDANTTEMLLKIGAGDVIKLPDGALVALHGKEGFAPKFRQYWRLFDIYIAFTLAIAAPASDEQWQLIVHENISPAELARRLSLIDPTSLN